jgi:hypothetical protein
MDATFSLYQTALNGMMLGTSQHDVDRMYQDASDGHRDGEAHLLLQISIALMDLARAESEQAAIASSLERAAQEFAARPTADRADWCRTYAERAVKVTAEARSAYALIGTLWSAYVAITK